MHKETKEEEYIKVPKSLIKRMAELGITNGNIVLLMGEIKCLAQKGPCRATNAHFMEVLQCKESTLHKYMKILVDTGCIRKTEARIGMKCTATRYIYPMI